TFTADRVTGKPNGPLPRELPEFAAAQGLTPKEVALALEKGVEGVYHLDPAKSPRAIDIMYLGPVRKTMLGIYTRDGVTLKLCLSLNPDRVDDRPTEFATRKGAMRVLVTLVRQSPEKDGEVRRFVGQSDSVRAVAFSPDGHYLLSGGGGEYREGKWL